MDITVNGSHQCVPQGLTIVALLERFALEPEATVVERNGQIVSRHLYATLELVAGDCLELVRFVGGG